jgi:hypothetical protein
MTGRSLIEPSSYQVKTSPTPVKISLWEYIE